LLAADLGHQPHLGSREVDVGRHQVKAVNRRVDHNVLDAELPVHQHVIDALLELICVDTHADSHRTLRVEVDQKHLATGLDERCAEVDGGGGLADPALLVAQRYDSGRQAAFAWLGLRKVRHRTAGGSKFLAHLVPLQFDWPSDERHSTAQIPSP